MERDDKESQDFTCSTQRSFFSAETKGKRGGVDWGRGARLHEGQCQNSETGTLELELWNYPRAKVKDHKKPKVIYFCGLGVYFK